MRQINAHLFFCFLIGLSHLEAGNIETNYIDQWKRFYPTLALDQGLHEAIFHFEKRDGETIQNWIDTNKQLLADLAETESPYVRNQSIDARLLSMKARSEIDRWERRAVHRHSIRMYTELIGKAVEPVLEAEILNDYERMSLVCQRMDAVKMLCRAAREQLEGGSKRELERSIKALSLQVVWYGEKLPGQIKSDGDHEDCPDLVQRGRDVAAEIQRLIDFASQTLLPASEEGPAVLGRSEYAKQLELYLDQPMTPEQLAEMAKTEIETVRGLIEEVSRKYVQKIAQGGAIPELPDSLVSMAFRAMERDAPVNGKEYLKFWLDLSEKAQRFIREKRIATLPDFQTLRIMPAPESAGAAARIGWVDSAPPFAPNPVTTLYLPSIPEDFPEAERVDFWSSFNKPFNRMIVIHELFPGHYMQIKISRETPHPVRLLFPYALYFEGWATFCERVVLDAGWDAENPLTYLAHLRKRLENANRAYTSVKVHCDGWTQEEVLRFSSETSLLAPQFAKSLWGRLMRSPMQMTSYFLGGKQFTELLRTEKKRMGEQFVLQKFMDTIMRSGAIPIDEFEAVFRKSQS